MRVYISHLMVNFNYEMIIGNLKKKAQQKKKQELNLFKFFILE